MKPVLLQIALAVAALMASGGADADERWVQYTPTGAEMRVATKAASCPAAQIDGRAVILRLRSAPGPDFPVRVCFAALPASARLATIGGVSVPVPRSRPEKIIVIGDTGCRLAELHAQSCNDPKAWPFAEGAAQTAAVRPDLVIHVGDFHYRERACPPAESGCQGSPYGDSWPVWMADFFEPARPLLQAAPWVMVRGNHEECGRGGKGWSRALDPYSFVSAAGCLGLGPPFTVDLGGLTLAVMDTSTAGELRARPDQVERFRRQFESLEHRVPSGPLWLTFHQPVWSVAASLFGMAVGGNATLAAASPMIPARTQMILSGHLHTFQILDFEDDLPVQVVSGHGGNDLHGNASRAPSGLVIHGAKIRTGRGFTEMFGYALLERQADGGWTVSNQSYDGKTLLRCSLAGRRLVCP